MTSEEIAKLFEIHDEEFIQFDRVSHKLSKRRDLHAFILLDKLCPGKSKMVSAAAHDEIYLHPEIDDLVNAGITEEQVIELIRCGLRYDDSTNSLAMFV